MHFLTRLALIASVMITLTIFLAQGSLRGIANEILDSDRAPLFPDLQQAAEALGLPSGLGGSGERTFRVIEVRNISGNDPFDEEQPFLNFNGVRVSSVAELRALIAGQAQVAAPVVPVAPAGGLAGCIGRTVQGLPSPTAPPELLFVNIRIDPATLNCQIVGGQGMDGDFLIFQFGPPDPGPPPFAGNGQAFSDVLLPLWRLVTPAGFINLGAPPFNVTQTAVLESPTNGTRLRLQYRAFFDGVAASVSVINLEVI